MHAVTLSAKYQLCIPKPIRDQMHLRAGQQFVFLTKEDGLHLVPKRNINSLKGLLKGANVTNVRDRKDRV